MSGSIVVGSLVAAVAAPASATGSMQRALTELRIAQCGGSRGEPLVLAESILQLRIGTDDLSYRRGAVVGNVAFWAGVAATAAALVQQRTRTSGPYGAVWWSGAMYVLASSVLHVQGNVLNGSASSSPVLHASALNSMNLTDSAWLVTNNTATSTAQCLLFRLMESRARNVVSLNRSTWSVGGNRFFTTCASCAVVEVLWDRVRFDPSFALASGSLFEVIGNVVDGGATGISLNYTSDYIGSFVSVNGSSSLSFSCNYIGSTSYGILLVWYHDNTTVRYHRNVVTVEGASAIVLSANTFHGTMFPICFNWTRYSGEWKLSDTSTLAITRNVADVCASLVAFSISYGTSECLRNR